jgi:hypothetical protein
MGKDYTNIGLALIKIGNNLEGTESIDKGLTILLEFKEKTGYHQLDHHDFLKEEDEGIKGPRTIRSRIFPSKDRKTFAPVSYGRCQVH